MKKLFLILLLVVFSLLGYSQNIITISNITINGNKVTKKEVILRELLFKKDSSLTITDLEKKIKQSKENLVNLKLFNFSEIN